MMLSTSTDVKKKNLTLRKKNLALNLNLYFFKETVYFSCTLPKYINYKDLPFKVSSTVVSSLKKYY